jgi:hypothetical protein
MIEKPINIIGKSILGKQKEAVSKGFFFSFFTAKALKRKPA